VPLELSIAYQNMAGPDGVQRTRVPVWSLVLNPPETIALTAGRVSEVLELGIQQASQLAIAVPARETLEYAAYEGPDVDLDSADVIEGQAVEVTQQDADRLAGGGPIANRDRARTEFFLAVGRTSLRDDESRAQFVSAFTNGRTDSLAVFIETTSVKEWRRFMEAVAEWVAQEMSERQDGPKPVPAPRASSGERPARTYEELFGEDDDAPTPASSTQPRTARPRMTPEAQAAALLTGASSNAKHPPAPEPDPAPAGEETGASALALPDEPDWMRSDERPRMLEAWKAWADVLRRLDKGYDVKDPTRLGPRELVTELRGMVGYARDTHDHIYGQRDDDPDIAPGDRAIDGPAHDEDASADPAEPAF
jgi:hypothetical protein